MAQAVNIQIYEKFFISLIENIKFQKPDWFNFGTKYFASNLNSCPIPIPSVNHLTAMDAINLPGGNMFHYIVQITEISVDLFPKTIAHYPDEINPEENYFVTSLKLEIGGVLSDSISNSEVRKFNTEVWLKIGHRITKELDQIDGLGYRLIEKMVFNSKHIEFVDFKPTGFENLIEDIIESVVNDQLKSMIKIPVEYYLKLLKENKKQKYFWVYRDPKNSNPFINNNRFQCGFGGVIVNN
jgi:hypothetical protein